ncbi:CopD family protein [Burkholderia ubonensis]|uniref:CopD family protein n=1 Tax=Burkholderia ubonensis TaxID=101571 RepID=UPI000B1E9661|nr:CopD family protein [Burkholderia ubonensis]
MSHAIAVALFLHLLAVAVWVGGMVFANFCLRPALSDLSPQLRLPLIEGVFGRFFNWVAGSVIVILLSGGFLLMQFGGAHATWALHAMAGLGVVMMLISATCGSRCFRASAARCRRRTGRTARAR